MGGDDRSILWRAPGEAATSRVRTDEFDERLDGGGVLDRREFVGVLASLSALIAGCDRQPPEAIVPRAHADSERTLGLPRTFATAVLRRGRAIGVLGITREGRPIKLEGNPNHPASLGAGDAMVQAELLTLYHPKRSAAIRRSGRIASDLELERELAPAREEWRRSGGRGLCILTGPFTSPMLATRMRILFERFPQAMWCRHDPLDAPAAAEGARLAAGVDATPVLRMNRADVVVSFDADVLGPAPDSIANARGLALRRHVRTPYQENPLRLYVAEPAPSITGAAADHRIAATVGEIEAMLCAVAARVGAPVDSMDGELSARHLEWVESAAADLRRAGSRGLAVAGPTLPASLHALTWLINDAIGAIGSTCMALASPEPDLGRRPLDLVEIAAALREGEVDSLFMIDANPVYTSPGQVDFKAAMAHASMTLHCGQFVDETAEASQWHIPLAHPLESWTDARAFDGTVTLLQPLIEPLYGGRTATEVVDLLLGALHTEPRIALRSFWRGEASQETFERWWRESLRSGTIAGSAFDPVPVQVDRARVVEAVAQWRTQRERSDGMELVIRPDPTIGAGEHAHNEWLQELPKPITKIVWSNALEIGPDDAARLKVASGGVVRLQVQDRSIDAPVWVSPGVAPGSATVTLGYGRRSGDVAHPGAGINAYVLRGAETLWRLRGVVVERTGERSELVTTQLHGRMEGSDPVRTVSMEIVRSDAVMARKQDLSLSLYPETPLRAAQQWGMAIDLTKCIGCGACTVACQAENNIPTVGPEQVKRGREMHWIRVDRYYAGAPESPRILFQPTPCMQCENAPCEVVCPVGATVHSDDGLNDMVYNRCIGTRYCSNNCPYKVRRFNFHAYADTRPSLSAMRNPEVTVRARGVMEKCTYCVQRIRRADLLAAAGDPRVMGGVQTACQQVCPTEAIEFGDLRQPESTINRLRQEPHEYALLEELNTRPRTRYLAVVRHPNPAFGAAESASAEKDGAT